MIICENSFYHSYISQFIEYKIYNNHQNNRRILCQISKPPNLINIRGRKSKEPSLYKEGSLNPALLISHWNHIHVIFYGSSVIEHFNDLFSKRI